MISSLLRQIARHSAVYSVIYVASSAVGLLMLPVYTRYLPESDYGTVALMDQSLYYFNVTFMVGTASALTRFYHESTDADYRKRVIGSGLGLAFAGGGLGAMLMFVFASKLASLVFGSESFSGLLRLGGVILLAQSVFSVCMAYFAAEKRSRTYVAYALVQLVFGVAANLFFVVYLKLGAAGMISGQALSNAVIAFVAAMHLVTRTTPRLDGRQVVRLVRFGLPLVPATILAAVVHNADQYLVRHFRGLSDVGVYALGYKLAFAPYSVITTSIGLVWSSALMYEISGAPNAPHVYARMTTYIMSLMVATLFCVSVFSDTLVAILAAPSYRAAEFVIPIVCLGLVAYGLHGFLSIGVMLQKRTGLLALTHCIAAVMNVLLNVALIPRYGYMVAAWTSVATYFGFAGVAWLVYRRVYSIPFEWLRLSSLIFLCIVLFLVSRVPVPEVWMTYALKLGAIGLLPVALFVGGFFKSEEKLMLDRWYRALAQKRE